jgi:hypothetical protein
MAVEMFGKIKDPAYKSDMLDTRHNPPSEGWR